MPEYIKRKDAIEALTGWETEPTDMDIEWALNSIPAEDVVPVVHGRWVRIQGMAPPEYHGKHMCSVCYARALERKFHEELSDYCPNCWAKMDAEVEKNECS